MSNCPSDAELEGIINTYGDRVIGIAIHPTRISPYLIHYPLHNIYMTLEQRTVIILIIFFR